MEELAEKVDQVIAATAAATAAQASAAAAAVAKGGWGGHRRGTARLQDGTLQQVDLTADLTLGLGEDDRDKLAELLRLRGVDASSIDAPRSGPPYKDVLQWGESLGQAFMKAWVQRVSLPTFVEEVCRCGEGLMATGQYALARHEIYRRQGDRALKLQAELDQNDPTEKLKRISACVRYYIGSSMCTYQHTIHRDPSARRPDTAHALRDVLRDLLMAVKLANSWGEAVREELYWAIYDASLLAMRVARWLRIHGFATLCVPPLTWLGESIRACLPFHAVHMLYFRTRFLRELIYSSEAARKLAEAKALSEEAVKQLKAVEELEVKFPPVPEETTQAFVGMLSRFYILRLKYDFWLGTIADATQLCIKLKEEIPNNPAGLVAGLLEVLQLQHGLPQNFGSPGGSSEATTEDLLETGDLPDPQAIRVKQLDLLAVLLDELQVRMDLAETAACKLEEFTAKRLAFEQQEELRARSEGSAGGEAEGGEKAEGDEPEVPLTAPERPTQEQLEHLGFDPKSRTHTVEEVLPLAAHVMLARECLRFELAGAAGERLQGQFKRLERSLALRLRYRHFLYPPLVDVDVIISPERNRDNVTLPDGFEFLTGDLNALSLRNRQIESQEADDGEGDGDEGGQVKPVAPQVEKPKGKHIYVIGQRFDAWESWIAAYPQPVKRLCDLRLVFSTKPPGGGEAATACGFHDPRKWEIDGKEVKPILQPYVSASVMDSSGFDHADETERMREALLNQLAREGHVKRKSLALPIEAHPGAAGAAAQQSTALAPAKGAAGAKGAATAPSPEEPVGGAVPYLVFSVYDEQSAWACDDEADRAAAKLLQEQRKWAEENPEAAAAASPVPRPESRTTKPDPKAKPDPKSKGKDQRPDSRLQPPELKVMEGVTNEALMPPWSPLLDSTGVATTTVIDFTIFVTKQMHAPVPSARFNAVIRADLRQTPGELLGKPFQSYAFACAAVDAPSTAFVARQLRIMGALRALQEALLASGTVGSDAEGALPEEPAAGEGALEAARRQRPELLDRLVEMATCLERAVAGGCGQIFLLDAADFLEDVCTHVFLAHAWPRLRIIQETMQLHELKERIISDSARMELSEWSDVVRRLLPLLLRMLERVQTVDALTLGSAAYALAALFLQENDSKGAQAELGLAIARLERDLAEASVPGTEPELDRPVAAAISFDPPALRSPSFALYAGDAEKDGPGGEKPRSTLLLSGLSRGLNKGLSRVEQDCICLLTKLYEKWIDCSLKVYLKNVNSTVRRARRPNDPPEEDEMKNLGGGSSSNKISLSNQEASVLSRLGDNPYLRCIFFAAVARRRPEAAAAAVGKACQEAESALQQERQLWDFCEKELMRQQDGLANPESFAEVFRKPAGKKVRADPAMVVSRSPTSVRFRLPPLPNCPLPAVLASSENLNPGKQDTQSQHSQRINGFSANSQPLTCAMFGKVAGSGSAVSDAHKELVGTGQRHQGYAVVEISGLKPNTNYCFATMFFEGFESTRPAASLPSETSPAIGSYLPLPLTLLRAELCKVVLRAGDSCKPLWSRAWGPLFESLCERTSPSEEADSSGLRSVKLRLDAADRLPPAVLAAFAEVALMKNRTSVQGDLFPATKAAQQATLRSANECLVAVDCARRAGNGSLALQGVSLTLMLVRYLLQYRTKPHALISLLIKCASSLESFEFPKRQLPWFSRARTTAAYLLHHIAVQCVQLRQLAVLSKQLEKDAPERYEPDDLADDAARAEARDRVRDHSLELALLGGARWQYAEGKACVALKDEGNVEELLAVLKDLSERSYSKAAKDAAQLALREDPAPGPFPMVLLRTAVARLWDRDGLAELPLADVLGRPPSDTLARLIDMKRQAFIDFGFILRALPPSRIDVGDAGGAAPEAAAEVSGEQPPGQPAEPPAGSPPADAAEGEAGGEVAEEPPPEPAALLAKHRDVQALAQLELLQAAPWLKELCRLHFHRPDVSTFKYFDLQQIAVPDLAAESADAGLGTTDLDDTLDTTVGAGDGGASRRVSRVSQDGEEKQLDEWEVRENEDKKSRKDAFELLEKCLQAFVRAATYASAAEADRLLQTVLASAFNALLIVGPSPAEIVPKGPKENPEDADPDGQVGSPTPAAEEAANAAEPGKPPDPPPAEEGSGAPVPESGLWTDLGLLAELAVAMLLRLRDASSPQAVAAAAARATAAANQTLAPKSKFQSGVPLGEEDAEAREVRLAGEAKRAMEAAEEDIQEVWFERTPELDVTSLGKLVAFAVLCLYHMRRWNSVILLCRNFNDATCSVFATTFLPLMIGAQKEICSLSARALGNTDRYMKEAKTTFDTEQKKLPRKVQRQLMLSGERSEPEKLFRKQSEYYEDLLQRQRRLNGAWEGLLKSLESMRNLSARAVPAATKQLRESRLLLANYLQERQDFELEVERGKLTEVEKKVRKRALGLASSLLVSSYRKSVELLRKRQMSDQVVQALHELGNLQWLEGDTLGARSSWSDAVDTAYQFVYAIKNWQKCVETAVTPPKDVPRAEIMLLTTAILAKYARLTVPKDVTVHVHAALFASAIVEAVVTSSLPHPSRRVFFSPDRYRLREICFGLSEARAFLPPNSVHGLDGMTFLTSLAFFHDTLMAVDYQTARCLPICAIHNYVATDVCRNVRLAVKGRLMTARGLIRCRSLTAAWLALYTLARGHDMPQPLLATEALDRVVADVQDLEAAGVAPYCSSEEPYTEANMQAVNKVTDPAILADGSEVAEAMGSANLAAFRFIQAELLVCVSSYGFVFSRNSDPEGKCKAAAAKWLESADGMLCNLWKSITENDDCSPQLESSEAVANPPARTLTEEESELCVEIRLLRSRAWELRGDLGRAAREILAGMGFLRLLAETGVKSSQDCRIGGEATSGLRTHPGTKPWMMLRRRIVHLLVAQGRLKAADAHITQGLQECQSAHDEVTRIGLLSAKVRVDILNGRLMELRGDRRLGAVPTAESCLAISSRSLPQPPLGAVYARLMLFLLLQQNPSLASHLTSPEAPDLSAAVAAAGGASEDPNEEMVLEAQGRILLSPMAQALAQESAAAAARAAPTADKRPQDPAQLLAAALAAYRGRQQRLVALVKQCIRDLDEQLDDLGFQLRPHNFNGLLHFGDANEAAADGEPPKPPPLLPPLKQPALKLGLRERPCPELPVSDSREPPNVYLELMPLRLHCELRLAQLHLELGELPEAERLLRDAEERMARCVHLLPWLYVQFCILKLRWRRLSIETGVAHVPPRPTAPNRELYRDPQAFANGMCPPTDSPLFRTFLQRAGVPSLTEAAEWVPGGRAASAEEGLQEYLQQLCGVALIATLEGGHDYGQISALLREGMEEVLRVKGQESAEAMSNAVYPFFCCLVAVAEARKALYFDPSPGYVPEDAQVPADPKAGAKGGAAKPAKGGAPAGPAPLDVAVLPRRIALDIYGHLKRQGPGEGALAYSAAALQELQKAIPLPTVIRHSMALRRECELFTSLFHPERLLSDQLHAALSQVSDAYLTAKVLGEPQLKTIEAPVEPPSSGDLLVHWTWHDFSASARPPDERCAFLLFICPLAEEPSVGEALVARRGDVHAAGLRRLWDGLSNDVDHVKPAAAVTSEYMSQRLMAVANLLRGKEAEAEAPLSFSRRMSASTTSLAEAELQAALQRLLLAMAGDDATADAGDGSPRSVPETLDAQKVQAMLQALVRLLDRGSSTARVSHPELSRFMRAVLGPLRLPKR